MKAPPTEPLKELHSACPACSGTARLMHGDKKTLTYRCEKCGDYFTEMR